MQKFESYYKSPTEKGMKTVIDIPFNIWEKYNLRGPVLVNVSINGVPFQSKLSPKGNGLYVLFFTKNMYKIIKPNEGETLYIEMEPRKVETSPPRATLDPKDARRIESISLVKEPINTACGQACIAMLAGVSIDDVFQAMGTKGPTSSRMLVDALYYYKIRHHERFINLTLKNTRLPELCLVDVKMPEYRHWVLYHKGIFYDPEFGELTACHEKAKMMRYLEICTA